ncbi:MAG: hypothetical protein J0M17_14890 [Planctomycetes bacterium]|nr:hypothetical protein [Planctomycetota bacterium]
MDVFARRTLVPPDFSATAPALLLEGSWPEDAPYRHALDDLIASPQFEHLDRDAQRLVEQLATAAAPTGADQPNFTDVNTLKLRYAAVKWLRIVAYCRHWPETIPDGCAVKLHLAGEQDAEYAALWQRAADAYGFRLDIRSLSSTAETSTSPTAPSAPAGPAWKRWLAWAFADRPEGRSKSTSNKRRILFVGNPRLLDGVCDEARRRGVEVAWLYDQLPARAWLRRIGQGVSWLTCEGASTGERSIPHQLLAGDPASNQVEYEGVDLRSTVEAWYRHWAPQQAGKQTRQWSAVARHFAERRFTHVLLDEDATPLARTVIAHARAAGVPSWVVQHGVCGVRFGFVPLRADGIFAWDEGSRRQLEAWGEKPAKIVVAGSPYHDDFLRQVIAARRRHTEPERRTKRILLAAVPSPRDERPDAVEFHLTRRTFEQMLAIVCEAVAKLPDVELVVKLHPRATGCDPALLSSLRRHPRLKYSIVQKPSLAEAVADVDCVISCASSAGVDAALASIPVVQILPEGSGDMIPAAWYGMLGSARSLAELRPLLAQALATPRPAKLPPLMRAEGSAPARILDHLLKY